MRHCTVVVAFVWILLPSLPAQTIRVATWELEKVEATSLDASTSEGEGKRLGQIAGSLRSTDAGIIILRGIPDPQTARRLAELLKPSTYHVALQSAFKKGGANNAAVVPPLTILSKQQPFAARVTEWTSTGQFDSPGGFAFAGFNSGTSSICLYVAHMPVDEEMALARRGNSLPMRKRELAAHYLVHHGNSLAATLTNPLALFLIIDGLVADPKGVRTEGPSRIFQQAGFRSALPNLPANRLAGRPADESNAPPILAALLTRHADFAATPQVVSRKNFAQPLITYDFVLAAPAPAVPSASAPTPASLAGWEQRLLAGWEQRVISLWVGAAAGLILVIGFFVWLFRWAVPSAAVPGKNTINARAAEFNIFPGAGERFGSARETGGVTHARPTTSAANSQAALWQERAVQAEHRANQAALALRAGLMPQLTRLMGERAISWLASQRGQLLVSHEIGTQRVLELEERLRKLQDQFAERLRSCEQRIAELEREILTKERVIRDLLRTQVRVAHGAPNQ